MIVRSTQAPREGAGELNESDLLALRAGAVSFPEFLRVHRRYFERQAEYFGKRAAWARAPLDLSDLEQIAMVACWHAVRHYHWQCSACGRITKSAQEFRAHVAKSHKRAVSPRLTMTEYVHGRVGSALDHEVTRYVRRLKFTGDLPKHFESADHATPEALVAYRELVEQVSTALDPIDRVVFEALASGHQNTAELHRLGVRQRVIDRAERKARKHIMSVRAACAREV